MTLPRPAQEQPGYQSLSIRVRQRQRTTRAEPAEGQAAAAAGTDALAYRERHPLPSIGIPEQKDRKSSYPQRAKSNVTCLIPCGLLSQTEAQQWHR